MSKNSLRTADASGAPRREHGLQTRVTRCAARDTGFQSVLAASEQQGTSLLRRRPTSLVAILTTAALLAVLMAAPATLAAPETDVVPPEVEQAVDRGLDWLARNQKPDGSFLQGGGSTTAVPSLAVMAFLARGHTPGQGKYGEVLNKAIDYVVSTQ